MSTCKECLHFEVCHFTFKGCELTDEEKKDCGFFKPKADYVEVVRCEECAYKEDCARQMVHTTRDYVLEQNVSTYNKVDYCSYGEKKGGAEQ